jgi:hypothetical protein
MKIEDKYIDELVDLRRKAREQKNWELADKIRNYLDTKYVYVFDTNEGQVIYHKKDGTRQSLVKQLKSEIRSENMFNAWLFTMKAS